MKTFRGNRAGFTLVELLVVISLVVLLATLVVAVLPSTDNRACSRAADQVQGWVAAARNRAVRDQTPRGVRLVAGNPDGANNAQLITEIQYLEQPDPYVPRSVKGVACTVQIIAGTGGNLTAQIGKPSPASPAGVPLPRADANSLATANPAFGAGDIFEANTGTTYRFLILGAAKTSNALTTITLSPGNPATNSFSIANLGYNNTVQLNPGECRIIRQPKPVIGEQPLLLPKGVCIDPTLSSGMPAAVGTGAGAYYDIVFGGRGEVLNQTSPQVILWVRSIEDTRWSGYPGNYAYNAALKGGFGSPTLLSISARSGAVAAHPVAASTSPLTYATDGMGDSGM